MTQISGKAPLAWVIAVVLMAANGSALASAYASQSIDSVKFGVIDLTPTDGIDADFTMQSPWSTRYISEYLIRGVPINSQLNILADSFLASGNVGGAHFFDQLNTNGSFFNTVQGSVARGDSVSTGFRQSTLLTLTPRSLLTVSGNYDFYGRDDSMSASGYLNVDLRSSATNTEGNIYSYTSAEDTFLYSVINNTDSAVDVWVDLEAWVTLSGTPPALSAVPEPGAYAMLLGGLGLFGMLGARRRSVQS